MTNIPLGITMAVVSSAAQALGLVLQRLAHVRVKEPYGGHAGHGVHRNPLWGLGMALFLAANLVGSSIQLSTLPILVLTPLQSAGLLFNSLFHALILKEPFTTNCLLGSIAIVLGSMGIAFTGNTLPEVDYSLERFVLLLSGTPFHWWIGFNVVLVCVSATTCLVVGNDRCMEWLISRCRRRGYYQMTSLFTYAALNNTLIVGLLMGTVSGTLSAHSILLAKSAIEIILSNLFHLGAINSPLMYFIVGAFLGLGAAQLVILNSALKRLSTSILYPLVFSTFNVFSILNYLFFYSQFGALGLKTAGLLVFGAASVILGVSILSIQAGQDVCLVTDCGDCASTGSTPLLKRCSVVSLSHQGHSANTSADLSGYVSFNSLDLEAEAAAAAADMLDSSTGAGAGPRVNYTNLLDDL